MSGDSQEPAWYRHGDVPESVRAAIAAGVPVDEIADALHAREFDTPKRRIRTMIETREPVQESKTHKDPPEETEAHDARYIDETDLSYLSDRDLAVVVGVALSQFGGSHRLLHAVSDGPYDLVWMGPDETVGLRTVSLPPGKQVGETVIREIGNEDSVPSDVREPTAYGVVSPEGFTQEAVTTADRNNVRTIGSTDLEVWLRNARLSPSVLGALPEVEDLIDEKLDELSNAQRDLHQLDPFDLPARERFELTEINIAQELKNSGGSLRDSPPSGGEEKRETGTLYADSVGEGDTDAVDRFMQGLEADSE